LLLNAVLLCILLLRRPSGARQPTRRTLLQQAIDGTNGLTDGRRTVA